MSELNKNEERVLKAMVEQAWDETKGEFGYTDLIKVVGLNKHEIAGYISDLKKKGYIGIYADNQFCLKKKVEKVFEKVEVYTECGFILKGR